MPMSKTCPRCGAATKERADRSRHVVWECGSWEHGGKFTQANRCDPVKRLESVARSDKKRGRTQEQILEAAQAILWHSAELLAIAGKLEGIACKCGTKDKTAEGHEPCCPVWLVTLARDMARGANPVGTEPSGKDVRHLAEPFRSGESSPCVRFTCKECGRYAHRESLITHMDDCPRSKETKP